MPFFKEVHIVGFTLKQGKKFGAQTQKKRGMEKIMSGFRITPN